MNELNDLEQEVLHALLKSGTCLSSYKISARIEDRWRAEGRRSRFLFWTFPKIIGFGTIHRTLDRLVERGYITRDRYINESTGASAFSYCPTDKIPRDV